jgi:hypothetical protein
MGAAAAREARGLQEDLDPKRVQARYAPSRLKGVVRGSSIVRVRGMKARTSVLYSTGFGRGKGSGSPWVDHIYVYISTCLSVLFPVTLYFLRNKKYRVTGKSTAHGGGDPSRVPSR